MKTYTIVFKVAIAAVVLFALLYVPAPLLPPHRFSEAIQSIGIGWKAAYLVAAIGLQVAFYGVIGILSALVLRRAQTFRGRLVQHLVVPLIIVLVAIVIRAVKAGNFPVWINAAIPSAACFAGVWLGLGFLYQRGIAMLFVLVAVMGATLWGLSGGPAPELSSTTESNLKRLVTSSSTMPSGDARFGALLQTAFAQPSSDSVKVSAVEHNRAAILALGLALGDERLARFVGVKDGKLLHQAAQLRKGTAIHKRGDWPRHFCLSAALAVLENPLVSDAGGLMKEQLDALTGGSGFSFCDFAADRAGVRFANAATNSEEDALAMQALLKKEFKINDFFPSVEGLPENLTTEQFRQQFETVGSKLYREKINEIESRLDSCAALSPLVSSQE